MSAPVVPCPTCKAPVTFNASFPYRPFCSERCKQIDLGAWANEEYRVPVVEQEADDDLPPAGTVN